MHGFFARRPDHLIPLQLDLAACDQPALGLRPPQGSAEQGSVTNIMVEEAKRDPTVQEIVVALRETTLGSRGRGGSGVVRRLESQEPAPDQRWAMREGSGERAMPARPIEIPAATALRDAEMQRLLDENAQLNQRVIGLLKLLEREQAARQAAEGEAAWVEAERRSVAAEVRGAIEAQVKPVLLTVLQLLQHLQSGVATPRVAVETETAAWRRSIAYRTAEPGLADRLRPRDPPPPLAAQRSATPGDAASGGYYPGWIADLIKTVGGDAPAPAPPPAAEAGGERPEPQRPTRGRHIIARLFGRAAAR
jgi:hypothetical protein